MWSYSGVPNSSPKDEVRFLCQDTISTRPLLQDEEIQYNLLIVSGSLQNIPPQGNFLAAAYCCDAIAAQYSSLAASKSVGDLSIAYPKRAEYYQGLATRLRARAAIAGVPITVTGQSLAKKAALYATPDATQAAVRVDGMDYAAPADIIQGSDSSGGL